MKYAIRVALAAVAATALLGGAAWAEDATMDDAHRKQAQELIAGGVKFLLSAREEDGGWSMGGGANKPAITAMVLKVLVQHPDFGPNHEVVKKGFDTMLAFRQKDGGIYDPKLGYNNYTTSVAVMALAAAKDPQRQGVLDDAIKYLRGQQILPGSESPDGDKITKDHPFAGGVSYGKHGRPDLSNVGMWLDAMHEAGVKAEDPAMQNALTFVARCQNRSESNPLPFAAEGGNDGGFIYAPALRGKPTDAQSMAGEGTAGKGLRSYGSMTYVGFKSMLYAGVAKDDPRVTAAYAWIRRYWRLDSNPNMPQTQSRQGLFYYYHVFAKALRAWGQPVIKDVEGKEHNWRHELIDALAKQVKPDGSWINEADRWSENSPVLVTSYVLLAVQETLK